MADAQPAAVDQPVVKYSHPVAAFFHVLFKIAAVLVYIFCGVFSSSFIINFVVIILLLAFDFWTVKNVTGRIMVGLRWWNEVGENGESQWRFEALDQTGMAGVSKKDSWLFWWTLYGTPLAWLALGIIGIIKFNFDYLLIVVVALVLSISNIVGYTKCRKDAKKKISEFAHQAIGSTLQSSLQNMLRV